MPHAASRASDSEAANFQTVSPYRSDGRWGFAAHPNTKRGEIVKVVTKSGKSWFAQVTSFSTTPVFFGPHKERKVCFGKSMGNNYSVVGKRRQCDWCCKSFKVSAFDKADDAYVGSEGSCARADTGRHEHWV